MVTKSMVYSIEEAEQVVEAVDRTGLVLLVTQTMRGDAKHLEAKRLCDSGVLGEVFLGEATYIHDLSARLRGYAVAHADAPGPAPGRRVPSHRRPALVHGQHRGGALLRPQGRRRGRLPPAGQLRDQPALRQRQDRQSRGPMRRRPSSDAAHERPGAVRDPRLHRGRQGAAGPPRGTCRCGSTRLPSRTLSGATAPR